MRPANTAAQLSTHPSPAAQHEVRRLCLLIELMILCVACVFVLFGTYARSFGDTANSRLATVYSLTEYGTFYIDPVDGAPNRFEQTTIDKVVVNDRMLSSKPPVLPLLMTGEYIILNTLFGWHLDSPEQTNQIIRVMSMTLIGMPYLLMLLLFSRMTKWFFRDPFVHVVLLICLAFCTQLWGYSTNINNHEPGAAMLVVALYFALGLGTGHLKPAMWRFFLLGLSSGLVLTIDMPVTIFVVPAALFMLYKFPMQTFTAAALGAAIPAGIHAMVLFHYTGNPMPVQMTKDFYLYETSFWRHPIGIDCLNEPKGTYLFNMTLGKCGLFSLFPVLMIGIAAFIRAGIRPRMAHRPYILAGGGAFVILSAYYCLTTNNYGGEAYGFRWYIGAMPVLLLMGGGVVEGLRKRWQWVFFALMMGVSFYSAWECTVTPWAANVGWPTRFLGRTY